MVKNENYVQIQGWMVNELKLKGNELLVFAIIYGFTQDDVNWFEGSLQYLADWTNSTKQGISLNLKSLVEKGFIEKQEYYDKKVKFCKYKSLIVLNKVEWGIKQSLMGGIKQSLINNNIINNNSNNIKVEELFEKFYKKYPVKKSKKAALKSFEKALKTVKFEEIMSGLEKYIKDIEKKGTKQEYIKHPSTWLNQGCWDDEYEQVKTLENKTETAYYKNNGDIDINVYNPAL